MTSASRLPPTQTRQVADYRRRSRNCLGDNRLTPSRSCRRIGLDLNAWALVDPTWHQSIEQHLRSSPSVVADRLEVEGLGL